MAIVNPNKNSIRYQALTKLSELAYELSLVRDWRKPGNREKRLRAIKLRYFLKSIEAADLVTVPVDVQNNILEGILCVSGINDYPVSPIVSRGVPQLVTILIQGPKGDVGDVGADGTDASIDVIPTPSPLDGSDRITVNEVLVGSLRTFELGIEPFVVNQVDLVSNVTSPQEIGETIETLTLTLTTTKGDDNILSVVGSPSNYDTALQSVLNLVDINDDFDQPVQTIVNLSNIISSATYQALLSTGENSAVSLNFFYPWFHGSSASILTQTNLYSTLTKVIADKGNKTAILNGTNVYFYFAFPASWSPNVLAQILNSSGLNVIGAFTPTTMDVNSGALDVPWTISYKIYRTTAQTTITNEQYSFNF